MRKDSKFCFFLSAAIDNSDNRHWNLGARKEFSIQSMLWVLSFCTTWIFTIAEPKILSQVFAVNLSQKYRLHTDRHPRRSVSGIERQWKCR